MSTTPRKVWRVRKFISTLGNVGDPEYLPLTFISEKYLPMHCLSNCEAEHHFSGSPIVYGWIIWEDERLRFIEAEFHAVVMRDGKLIDITPRVDGEEKVVFVPDNDRVAVRLNNRQWKTWKNYESYNGTIKDTEAVVITNNHDDRLF